VVNILYKRLRLFAYKEQLVEALEPDDNPRHAAFATEMLQRMDEDNDYLRRVCFSDEATCHTSGKVNRHNVRICGLENPRIILENERNSPKVNVWCTLMHNKIIGPFLFSECTISAIVYLDMMELYAAPQPWVVLQQDGAPPHWGLLFRQFSDATFPNR
jgi:hypothetical protein